MCQAVVPAATAAMAATSMPTVAEQLRRTKALAQAARAGSMRGQEGLCSLSGACSPLEAFGESCCDVGLCTDAAAVLMAVGWGSDSVRRGVVGCAPGGCELGGGPLRLVMSDADLRLDLRVLARAYAGDLA
ncbi:hypothetical protein GCM10009734_05360 [Nonomuraea bangladeshensis]